MRRYSDQKLETSVQGAQIYFVLDSSLILNGSSFLAEVKYQIQP